MPEFLQFYKNLPSSSFNFNINLVGAVTKTPFSGNFVFQIPNIRVRAEAEKEKARLNQGLDKDLDDAILSVHLMYSYLKHTLLESPDWFKESNYGYDLYDGNVLTTVYLKCVEYENEWAKRLNGEPTKSEQ